FFFQAEDGIRDDLVTGVQTCALPILREERRALVELAGPDLADRAGDPLVGSRAPLGELGAVGDLLRQRMLERILGDRIEALGIEIGRASCRERVQTYGVAGSRETECT